jgi:enoyl-[acyl-carrier protein] reductase/trans-2-enoyl-CoA reductase (NAD+)
MKLVYMQKYQWRCFSNEVKKQTLDLKKGFRPSDLIIYSLASPVRMHPNTAVHRSVLKPIGGVLLIKL